MRKEKLYLAGSLFSEAEINQRLKEGNMLESMTAYEVFNPITAPCNDKDKLPTAGDIFFGDTSEVIKSDVVIANLDHEDPGVMAELGISWGLEYAYSVLLDLYTHGYITEEALSEARDRGVKNKKVIAVAYDLREGTAGEYNGIHIPFGRNQFVIGMIEDFVDGTIVEEFEEAICLL